jgi:hypothetical protein
MSDNFRKNIRYLLAQTGIKKKIFAEAVGVNGDTVSLWIKEKPAPSAKGLITPPEERLKKIADYFNRTFGTQITASMLTDIDLTGIVNIRSGIMRDRSPQLTGGDDPLIKPCEGLSEWNKFMNDRLIQKALNTTIDEIIALENLHCLNGWQWTTYFYVSIVSELRRKAPII